MLRAQVCVVRICLGTKVQELRDPTNICKFRDLIFSIHWSNFYLLIIFTLDVMELFHALKTHPVGVTCSKENQCKIFSKLTINKCWLGGERWNLLDIVNASLPQFWGIFFFNKFKNSSLTIGNFQLFYVGMGDLEMDLLIYWFID